LLFVTGGLGPTTDDFTRDVIATWSQKKMIFDEASWIHIQERLSSRGVPIREAQRQQCYFPEGSTVLFNKNGTANGFSLEVENKRVYILPGPPNEIEGIWNDFLRAELLSMTKEIDPSVTKIWECLGQGESEISHLTEIAMTGSGLEIGYRAHLPYVEVKVSYAKSTEAKVSPWLSRLEAALEPYTVLRDGADVAHLLTQKMTAYKNVLLVDELTGPHLLGRIFPHAQKLLREKKLSYSTEFPGDESSFDLILHLKSLGPNDCEASLITHAQKRRQTFHSPYTKAIMEERQRQYFAETGMLFWNLELDQSTQPTFKGERP
jgi:molybdopterin-biosynthesis enzyme MoeA-like protein